MKVLRISGIVLAVVCVLAAGAMAAFYFTSDERTVAAQESAPVVQVVAARIRSSQLVPRRR